MSTHSIVGFENEDGTPIELDRLEALANAATFGEWRVGSINELYTEYMDELMGMHPRGHFRFQPDAEVAAAAVNALPALVAEIRRLRAQVERVKAEAWAEGNLAAYPLQLAVGQFIDNGGDAWGNLDNAYEQVSAAANPYRKEDE